MEVLDHYPMSPGSCFLCTGTATPCVDTRKTLDWEGAIYICELCVGNLAGLLNWEPPGSGELARADAARAKERIAELEVQVEAGKAAVIAITAAFPEPQPVKRGPGRPRKTTGDAA